MKTIALLLALGSCGVHRAETRALTDPGDPDAWEKLGDAHRMRFQGRRAAEAYRTAYSLDPSRTHLQRRTAGAVSHEARDLRRAAMRTPNDDEMWGDLGDVLQMEGNTLEARAAYLRAFKLDRYDSEWQARLAELGAGELVLQEMAAQVVETDDESLGDYGDLLSTIGRHEEACEQWRRAAELDPYDEEWVRHASECGYPIPEGYVPPPDTGGGGMYGGGVYEEVYSAPEANDLESLVARVSSDSGLLVRLGQAYLRAGDGEKATETLWGALLVAPNDEEALQSYLVATSKTRREVLETLRNTFPDNDEVVGLLADHYLDLGLRDRARDLYDLAHTLDADDPEWEAKRTLLEASR